MPAEVLARWDLRPLERKRGAAMTATARLRGLLLTFTLVAAQGCAPTSECKEGGNRCYGNQAEVCSQDCGDRGCSFQWRPKVNCVNTSQCLSLSSAQALCVLSSNPTPRCQGTTAYCDQDAYVACNLGYAIARAPCGSSSNPDFSLPGGASSTHCIALAGGATCVPPGASPNPICAGGSGALCSGNDLKACVAGYLVFESHCQTGSDCAKGLVCIDNGTHSFTCTATCTADPRGGPPADCTTALGGVLPLSGYSGIQTRGTRLECIAGYCEWEP